MGVVSYVPDVTVVRVHRPHRSSRRLKDRSMIRKRIALMPACLFLSFWQIAASPQDHPARKTQVVMLGTGTPLPDPGRAGPSTALIVNGTAYLVDAGTGVVRRAAAARDRGIKD